MKNVLKKLKPYLPYIIGVFVFVSFFAIGRKIWLMIFPKDHSDGKKSPEDKIFEDQLKESAQALVTNDQQHKMSWEEAKVISSSIFEHLNGVSIAGLHDGFESVMKLLVGKKKADLAIIYASFGVKNLSPWPAIGIAGIGVDYQPLAGWCKKAFSDSEYEAISEAFGKWPKNQW